MRLLATISIQPHLKKKITAKSLIPLPWDHKLTEKKRDIPKMTPEQHRQRVRELESRIAASSKTE